MPPNAIHTLAAEFAGTALLVSPDLRGNVATLVRPEVHVLRESHDGAPTKRGRNAPGCSEQIG